MESGCVGEALVDQQTSEELAVPLLDPGQRIDEARAEFHVTWEIQVRQKEQRLKRLRHTASWLREWAVSWGKAIWTAMFSLLFCLPLLLFLGMLSFVGELVMLVGWILAGEAAVYLVLSIAGGVIGVVADRLETREIKHL